MWASWKTGQSEGWKVIRCGEQRAKFKSVVQWLLQTLSFFERIVSHSDKIKIRLAAHDINRGPDGIFTQLKCTANFEWESGHSKAFDCYKTKSKLIVKAHRLPGLLLSVKIKLKVLHERK